MAVTLNHTIVTSRDKEESARFLSEVLGLPAPVPYGPFLEVESDNGVLLAFIDADPDDEITSQHYAFLIGEDDFDAIFGRVTERGLDYFADPAGRQRGEINHGDGGRGFYFADPSGHWLEVLTRPYGSAST
jgi:catechol 2,3-dioxygenase-like lactoylglutathione lyase family enzyme